MLASVFQITISKIKRLGDSSYQMVILRIFRIPNFLDKAIIPIIAEPETILYVFLNKL